MHALRVATRRLLAHCDLLGVILKDEAVGKLRRTLRKRLKMLADLRDGQVQLAAVSAQNRAFPEMRPFQALLEKNEKREITAAAKALGHDRNEKLRKQLTVATSRLAAAMEPVGHARQHELAIQRALQARLQKAVQRQRVAGVEVAAIHRVRVALKKYRYLLEALRPVMRKVDAGRFQRLVEFQEVTGDIHDIAILLARIESLVSKKKLEAWRTHRFRETLTRRRAALMQAYGHLSHDLFAKRAAALQFAL